MKFLKPFFPFLISLSLIWSLAIFIAGTLIFLAMQAFYEIHINNGAIAYLWVFSGVVIVCVISHLAIKAGFWGSCCKKKAEAKSAFEPFESAAKVLLSVLVYEGLKFYLDKKDQK